VEFADASGDDVGLDWTDCAGSLARLAWAVNYNSKHKPHFIPIDWVKGEDRAFT
jgi:hypothetical protein